MKKRVRGAAGWGVVVRRLREERGWSQGQLAYHAEVDQSQISKIESGAQEDARLSTVTGLAGALGVTPDTLLGLRPSPPLAGDALPGTVLEQLARVVRAELDRALGAQRPQERLRPASARERPEAARPEAALRRRRRRQQASELGHAGLSGADYRYLGGAGSAEMGRLVRAAAPTP